MPPVQIEFRSRLSAPPAEVWQRITSFKGISAEMFPLMRMSVPRGVKRLTDIDIVPGKPMFRLAGSTLGLVGFGNIAREIAVRAAAFGMRVLYSDPFVK